MGTESIGRYDEQPTEAAGSQESTADRAPTMVVQPKLQVGAVDDPLEREADLMAARVVAGMSAAGPHEDGPHEDARGSKRRVRRSMTAPPSSRPTGEAARVRRTAAATVGADGGAVDHDTESRIKRAAGGGQPLDADVQRGMERGFGVGLGHVRVHTDAQSHDLNERIQAKAFTTGSDVFFRRGEYEPDTTPGQHLLAHELAHVVQQSHGSARRAPADIHRWPSFGRKKNAPQEPPGGLLSMLTLTEGCRAFVTSPDGMLSSSAEMVTLPAGTAISMTKIGGAPEKAQKPDGKDSAFFRVRVGGDHYAVPESATKPSTKKSKKAKGAGWTASGLNEAASLTNLASGSRTDFQTASARQESKGLAPTSSHGVAEGSTVDYNNMTASEQAVYDKANHYESAGEAVTAGANTFGSWFSMIGQMKGFYDNWATMNKKEKANAIAEGFGSFVSTAAATSELVTQAHITANADEYAAGNLTSSFGMRPVKVAGSNGKLVNAKEHYQATDPEKASKSLGMIAGGVQAALKVKDALVNFATWCKHLGKKDKRGGLAREGVATVQSFGVAAQSTMKTVLEVRKFFEGSAGVAAQTMPIFGLILNGIELIKRGMDIYKAQIDGKLVKASKKSLKERFTSWWPVAAAGDGINHKMIRIKKKQLEDRQGTPREQATDAERLDAIEEYELDRDLANTANKRRNRAILAVVTEVQSVAANISTLAGAAPVAAGFRISGAVTSAGAVGVRKLKQFGRNRGWKGFNKNKTTEKKEARYAAIAERLYGDFLVINSSFETHLSTANEGYRIETAKDFDAAVSNEIDKNFGSPEGMQVQQIQAANAQLKGRVKAAGLSWREFCAEEDPVSRFQMLIAGQKKRE